MRWAAWRAGRLSALFEPEIQHALSGAESHIDRYRYRRVTMALCASKNIADISSSIDKITYPKGYVKDSDFFLPSCCYIGKI